MLEKRKFFHGLKSFNFVFWDSFNLDISVFWDSFYIGYLCILGLFLLWISLYSGTLYTLDIFVLWILYTPDISLYSGNIHFWIRQVSKFWKWPVCIIEFSWVFKNSLFSGKLIIWNSQCPEYKIVLSVLSTSFILKPSYIKKLSKCLELSKHVLELVYIFVF